jgi:hypothetical protein
VPWGCNRTGLRVVCGRGDIRLSTDQTSDRNTLGSYTYYRCLSSSDHVGRRFGAILWNNHFLVFASRRWALRVCFEAAVAQYAILAAGRGELRKRTNTVLRMILNRISGPTARSDSDHDRQSAPPCHVDLTPINSALISVCGGKYVCFLYGMRRCGCQMEAAYVDCLAVVNGHRRSRTRN